MLAFALFLLSPCVLQAETCDELKAKYEDDPSDINKEQMFIYSNEYYLPYDRCSDLTSFEITNLEEKVEMGFISREITVWDILLPLFPLPKDENFHHNCIFRAIKVEYTVECSNKLKYKGTKYLLSDTRKENESTDLLGTTKAEMEAEVHDWITIPLDYLNSDGSITIDHVTDKQWKYKPEKLNIDLLLENWKKQKVAYPEHKFMGTPGKLARPVLLIHGLDYAYDVWGVEIYDEGTSEFREGNVKKYKNGSLPDMLARSNNLYTESENDTIGGKAYSINSNGIYFFQSPRIAENIDAKPHWSNDIDSSQSRYLYEKIKFVMNDFYKEKLGIDWEESDKYQIDLVGHSQGGLVVREMLRGLRKEPYGLPAGNANAANHINRVITVNTPHFGSALATDTNNLSSIEQEFPGVATIIRDIENPVERTLLKADVDVDFWERYYGITEKVVDIATENLGVSGILGLAFTGNINAGNILTVASTIAGAAAATDVTLTIKGPYLGIYKPEVFVDVPGPFDETRKFDDIETMERFKKRLEKPRKSGGYLYKNDEFIDKLNTEGFPRLPNGDKITLLPMYSNSTDKIITALFEEAGEETKKLCAKEGDGNQYCLAVGTLLKNFIKDKVRDDYGYEISKQKIDGELLDAILSIKDDWLAHSDAVVEDSSQKFISNTNQPDNKYFLEPRKYAIHDALAPWEPVLHGPFESFKGAPQQGLDILCALSPACDKAFAEAQKNGGSVLKLSEMVYRGGFSERHLDVAGDFSLTPIFISEGAQAFSISAGGESVVTAKYEPGVGSSVTIKYGGTEITELLLGPEFATQPSISRKGDSIYVTFTNYSGKPFQEAYYLPGLSSTLTAAVIAEGSSMSSVIIGSGTAADPETQKPSTPPPGHRLAPVTLAVLHREARGEHESNTSRPRFLVFNATEDTLEFSKVAYYFTADPARTPKVAVDYPYVPVSVEHLGGDQWRFVFNVGNQKISPKAFYPSVDGWQIRVHYSDWFEYRHLDDWSADYSLGFVQLNRKIVVYDKNGKIIWGSEAPGFESEDDGIIPMSKGTIAWKDDAPWEVNALKPRVTVTNTGSVAFSDYHAQLWFRVPQGKSLSPLNVWYAPESSPSVKNIGGRVWLLDLHFDKHILYPGDSVSEGNVGLNLADWSLFDKTVCGVALKDKDGNILYGREPSVEECESYNGPNLLLPLYSWIKE
jgi:hypothetical protein